MSRCQWRNLDGGCKNQASRWFLRTQGDFLWSVCSECANEFWKFNRRGCREISREEAEVWKVHNV